MIFIFLILTSFSFYAESPFKDLKALTRSNILYSANNFLCFIELSPIDLDATKHLIDNGQTFKDFRTTLESMTDLGLKSITISFLIIESLELPDDIEQMAINNKFSGLSMKITKESFKIDTSAFLTLLKSKLKDLIFDETLDDGKYTYNEYYGSLVRVFTDFISRDINKVVRAKVELDKLITQPPEFRTIDLSDADFEGLTIIRNNNLLILPIRKFFKNEAILIMNTTFDSSSYSRKLENLIKYKDAQNDNYVNTVFGNSKSENFVIKNFMKTNLLDKLSEVVKKSNSISKEDDIIMMMDYKTGFTLFNRIHTLYGPKKIYTQVWFVSTVVFGGLVLLLIISLVLKV